MLKLSKSWSKPQPKEDKFRASVQVGEPGELLRVLRGQEGIDNRQAGEHLEREMEKDRMEMENNRTDQTMPTLCYQFNQTVGEKMDKEHKLQGETGICGRLILLEKELMHMI